MRFTLALLPLLAASALADDPYIDPNGPFRLGEGFGTSATCDTIGEWYKKAPEFDGRISMVMEGTIREAYQDEALAYLIMCGPEDDVQVMCIAYAPREASDQRVRFAGGFLPVDERRILIDPCLVITIDDTELPEKNPAEIPQ